MTRFYVVTPEYEWRDVILDDGTGPSFYEADVVEIEAENKRDAIAFGVKWMLTKASRDYKWCRDARADGVSPYAGVKAIPVDLQAEGRP